ncbi:MAG TPA: hypothetical protein PKI59_05930 [Candidatus Cloacimonadota bacterium]|nr:hypothetical protein [Candidatus Cloacimonadota bacterium]
MNKMLILAIMLISLACMAWGVSIYDIQYTSMPGSDNTYPSRYAGKSVSTEGIVAAVNYRNGGYFISETIAGPYSGILVLDSRSSVNIGDRIRISGTVYETFGMTCLQDITNTTILERNHPLPHPVTLTTAQLTSAIEAEAYEGVYARVLSISTANSRNSRGKFSVTDGTGLCTIQLGTFTNIANQQSLSSQFSSITGIVIYGFGEFSLNPISRNDLVENQPVSIQNRSWGRIKSIYK